MWKRIMGCVMMVALVLNFTGAAHAGDWPSVGDMVNRNGTVLKVAKMKMLADVDVSATMVCLNKTGNKNAPCTWAKIGDLNWMTYNGTRQEPYDKPVNAYTASKCVAEVNGVTIINGPCKFESYVDGDFAVATAPHRVTVNEKDGAGWWYNEKTGVGKDIGTMTRNGACWSNKTAKVCTWR